MVSSSEFETRLSFVLAVISFFFAVLFVRLFYLQVVQGANMRTIAEANRTSLLFERAPRGLILDRTGQVLADNRQTFLVLFTPLELNKDVLAKVIHRLAGILGMKDEDLERKLAPAIKHSSMVRLLDRASRSTAFALEEQKPNLPGVSVVTEMQRNYPKGAFASHLLGYLSQVNAGELQELRQEGYQADWLIGKMGLEKNFDRILRGEYGGMRIEVDASGRSVKILDRKKAVSGFQIRTTLDARIQQAAEQAMAAEGKPGSVVAMDPKTGEILAFVSAPSFDPNVFLYTRGELANMEGPASLVTREDLPMFNRAVQGTFPPGSIYKIVTAAAAIESKKVSPYETYFCPGFFTLGGGASAKKISCWKKTGHGNQNFSEAIMNSCNVYFCHVGLKVGPDAMETLSKKFGLGAQTGIGLPGEKSGYIPGRSMFKKGNRHWYDGDTVNMSIGQGTVLFTPVQAARMIAAVASHGKIYQPQILKEIRTPDGELYEEYGPKQVGEVMLADSTWNFLDQSLTRVVAEGTGQASKIPNITIGGKTGTAQNPHGKDHAWFVAYAPVEDPKIAVAVFVEHGIKGGVAGAPIAKKVIEAALLDPASQATQEIKKAPAAENEAGD